MSRCKTRAAQIVLFVLMGRLVRGEMPGFSPAVFQSAALGAIPFLAILIAGLAPRLLRRERLVLKVSS